MPSSRQLYKLPQKQLDRANRRQQYDIMAKTSNDPLAAAAALSTNVHNNNKGKAIGLKTEQKQKQQIQQQLTIVTGEEVAALPLLLPFQIKNPSESIITSTLLNEQHAFDTLTLALNQEKKLRTDLQKAKNNADDKTSKDEDNNNNNSNNNSNNNKLIDGKSSLKAITAAAGGGGGGGGKKSKKSKKNANVDSAKVKVIEAKIDTITVHIANCRASLAQFTHWTKAMLQAEYSKIALSIHPDSQRYIDLEDSLAFLCPRLSSEQGAEDYFHEQRLAYVKEMIPIMKKVGERNIPSSLLALPYIQKFQCDDVTTANTATAKSISPIIASLMDEMYQLVITEGVRVKLEKQLDDPAKFNVLKHVEEKLDQREVLTSELVRKHYRKRSIKLHPDRNGEHMRPIFEEFTDARTVLSDVKLRQSYLRGMLDVFNTFSTNPNLSKVMDESHDAWNRKHRPDQAEGDVKKKGGKKQDESKPLKLEGGLHQQVPKGVMLFHRRDGKKNHVVSVSVNVLRPIWEFYAKVRSIKVEFRDTTDEKHVIELGRSEIVKTIKFDKQGPILANEIPVVEMELNPGHWEVFWNATLDTVGTDPLNPQNATQDESVTTRSSAKSCFHVVDYDSMKNTQDFHDAEGACKIIKGELSNTLHKLRTNQVDSASMNTSARFGFYHQVLVRARKRNANLLRLMKITGKSSAVYADLCALLAESRQEFAELERKADAAKKRKEKKDDTKRFKAFVASILESDEPCSWMMGVTEAELYREGGDINRIYQLFIEGKGKYTLLIDSEMYKEAALRKDVFSPKQCQELAVRGEEVAIQEAKEEEEARAVEERRKKEEEERAMARKEAELNAKWSMVGQNATVHGLASDKGKALNHQMAKIIYYVVDRDRFEVQPYNSEEKVYLKKENLIVYYGHVPKSKKQQTSPKRKNKTQEPRAPLAQKEGRAWNCNKCTFENDDASTECSICTNPRMKPKREHHLPIIEVKDKKKEEPVPEKPKKMTPVTPKKTVVELSPVVKDSQVKKTIYVQSSHTKKLTGEKGRKKKDLLCRSGAAEISIQSSASVGNQVPVLLTGNKDAVWKAIALIQETIGMENVAEKITKSPPPQPAAPVAPTPVVPPSAAKKTTAPAPVVPAPVAPPAPAGNKSPTLNLQQTNTGFGSGIFSGLSFAKPTTGTLGNGINHVSVTETETRPSSSQYSFGDALLPRGLMDMSMSTSNSAVPPELPSEIGIDVIAGSISSINDRSNERSNAYSNFTLNENDPLLKFLKCQSPCIKGNVDDFYKWLVTSEDIDSMGALQEAVSDDDYLNETLKAGSGASGLKGFKRKAFHRAVTEYDGPMTPIVTSPPKQTSTESASQMSGSAFLPANLFGSDDPNPGSVTMLSEPPEELVCPIGLALMTVDPVLAADGVTYERESIENWLQTNIANIQKAQDNLKWNPTSERDIGVVKNGIRSPAYGTMMSSFVLTPNTNVRNMARAYKEQNQL